MGSTFALCQTLAAHERKSLEFCTSDAALQKQALPAMLKCARNCGEGT